MHLFRTLAAIVCLAPAALGAAEIQFWHAMQGPLGEEVDALVRQFNESQKEHRVVASYKGSYDQTMAEAFIAHRAGKAPHVVQVYELGTANMMAARSSVRPVWQVMAEAGEKLETRQFVPAVASYFSDAAGHLHALPFNTSTPVMFYNKAAFRKAGLDPERPPKTWYEMVGVIDALLNKAELPCGYATSWPSWVLLENSSAWHNLEFATKGNGLGGLDTKLVFNTHVMMRHIGTLSSWAKAGYFTYTGRGDEAEAMFKRGECGLLTASSATYAELQRDGKLDFGVAGFPYYDDVKGAPQNTLIGGAALWVMGGHKADEYRATAKFFSFLKRPEVQAAWHQKTGYVPTTTAAYELTRKQGFYAQRPGHEIAISQLLLKNPTADTKGIRLGFFPQIRALIEEELELVWAQKKTSKDALDSAAARGNEILRRFEAAAGPVAPAERPGRQERRRERAGAAGR